LTVACCLPTALRHSGNLPGAGVFAETQTAHLELPQVRPRPPAQRTTVVLARFEFRLLNSLGFQASACHVRFLPVSIFNSVLLIWRRTSLTSPTRLTFLSSPAAACRSASAAPCSARYCAPTSPA